MGLKRIPLSDGIFAAPGKLVRMIEDARTAEDHFRLQNRKAEVRAFHSGDFEELARLISEIDRLFFLKSTHDQRPKRFCEWGSGLAIASAIAEQFGMQAVGIESEVRLHEAAVRFKTSINGKYQLFHGSFIPDSFPLRGNRDRSQWLDWDSPFAGLEKSTGDLTYAYPWPGEEGTLFELFDFMAEPNNLLLTFHGAAEFQLHMKN